MFIRVNQINSPFTGQGVGSGPSFKNEIGINVCNITQFQARTLPAHTGGTITVTVINLVGYPEEELFVEETFNQLASVIPVMNATVPPTSGDLDFCAASPSPPGAIVPVQAMACVPFIHVNRIMNNTRSTPVPVAILPLNITWFEPVGYQNRADGGWRTDSVRIHTGGAPIRAVHADISFDNLCTYLSAVDVVP